MLRDIIKKFEMMDVHGLLKSLANPARRGKQQFVVALYLQPNRAFGAIRRSGVSAERRKPLEIEECGFLPNAATLLLQRFHFAGKSKLARPGRRNESKTCLRREVNYPFLK